MSVRVPRICLERPDPFMNRADAHCSGGSSSLLQWSSSFERLGNFATAQARVLRRRANAKGRLAAAAPNLASRANSTTVWRVGELCVWSQREGGTWVADVQWRPDGEPIAPLTFAVRELGASTLRQPHWMLEVSSQNPVNSLRARLNLGCGNLSTNNEELQTG